MTEKVIDISDEEPEQFRGMESPPKFSDEPDTTVVEEEATKPAPVRGGEVSTKIDEELRVLWASGGVLAVPSGQAGKLSRLMKQAFSQYHGHAVFQSYREELLTPT